MIRSFRGKEAETLHERSRPRTLPASIHRVALRKLAQIDAATTLDDLRASPGNHLEKLAGDRAGQYSIRINDRWRICFRWQDADAFDVEIVDYH